MTNGEIVITCPECKQKAMKFVKVENFMAIFICEACKKFFGVPL